MNIFEQAAKTKLRINYKGLITAEDLYDLTMNELNEIYITTNKVLKDMSSEGLISEPDASKGTEGLQLILDLVKHVFKDKENAMKAKQDEAARKEKKRRIMEIIADKEDASLMRKSKTDLLKMLEDL
jgi:hypothetical protein